MVDPKVIDTSVFISGVLTRKGTSGLVLDHAFERCTVLFSEATFEELERKLKHPKFSRVVSKETAQRVLALCTELGAWIEPETVEAVSRDSEDDMFLAVAKAGDARQIVSLDKDLLVLNPWQGVEILKPYDFLVSVS